MIRTAAVATAILLAGCVEAKAPAPAATVESSPNPAASCAAHGRIVATLAGRYGERPVAMGLTGDGLMIEVFAGAETGTFTILLTSPSGLACVLATGEAWQGAEIEIGEGA